MCILPVNSSGVQSFDTFPVVGNFRSMAILNLSRPSSGGIMSLFRLASCFLLTFTVSGFAPTTFVGRKQTTEINLMREWAAGAKEKTIEEFTDRLMDPALKRAKQSPWGKFLGWLKPQPEYKPPTGSIQHQPTKDMTNVDPAMTNLCATICDQLYKVPKEGSEFKLSTSNNKAEVLIFDDHGDFEATSPPFVAVVTRKTMILGWRGSQTIMDWINDFALSPQASLSWTPVARSLKAQGAFASIVENEFALHGEELINEVKSRGITEIITTGHSLGGGLAQVAHVFLKGQMKQNASPWKFWQDKIKIKTLNFSGPMTLLNVDEDEDAESKKFIKEVADNSCVFIFANDPVPRAYGYLSFIEDVIDAAVPSIAEGKRIPQAIGWVFGLKERIEDAVDSGVSRQSVQNLVLVASQYRHFGKIVYYKDQNAKPKVLDDKGAFYDKDPSEKGLLRDIKFGGFETFFLEEIQDDHMFTVKGPGLAYDDDEVGYVSKEEK